MLYLPQHFPNPYMTMRTIPALTEEWYEHVAWLYARELAPQFGMEEWDLQRLVQAVVTLNDETLQVWALSELVKLEVT